jgi:hypothetical protein
MNIRLLVNASTGATTQFASGWVRTGTARRGRPGEPWTSACQLVGAACVHGFRARGRCPRPGMTVCWTESVGISACRCGVPLPCDRLDSNFRVPFLALVRHVAPDYPSSLPTALRSWRFSVMISLLSCSSGQLSRKHNGPPIPLRSAWVCPAYSTFDGYIFLRT